MDIEFRISHIRALMCHRGDVDYDREIERHLDELLLEVGQLLAIAVRNDGIPASMTVTVAAAGDPHSPKDDTTMNPQFPLGTPLVFTAHVANAEGVDLPAAPVSWTSDNGTVNPDASDSHIATLVNAGLGTANVVAVTANGVSVTTAVDIVDNTPATMTVDVAAAA